MKYKKMTKEQLIKEIVQMQKKIAGLEEVVCYLKSTDEKLQESEERYRAIFELAADSIVLIDAETGMLVDFNKKAHENLNFTREEFEKLKISDFEVVESEEEVQRHFKKIVDEGSDSFETKHRKKGGELCDIQVSSKAISIRGKDFIQSIWMNISNLKRVEEALRESEEKYRTLFNSSLVGSYLVESGGKILDTNEAGAALLGFDNPEDMIGKSILDFYKNPEDRTKIFSEIESNDNVSFELELLKKDGSEVIAFISTALITFGGGKATLTSGIDITHLKRIETALRDSETKYRTLFEDSKDPIFIITRAGDFVNVNQSGLELFGYTRDELIGLNVLSLYVNPDDRSMFQQEIEKKGSVRDYEVTLQDKRGTKLNCLLTSTVWLASDGSIMGYQGVIRDITEKKKMEEELLKSEKLESVGILAGGIAHDFNNILTAILGNITLAKEFTKPHSRVYERLVEIEKASMRAKDLTQQLLTFSEGGVPIKKTTSISELIKDSTEFALRGSNVRCDFFFSDDLLPIDVDEGQMSQVINNLIINADQAMPNGGIVKIHTKNITIGKENSLPLEEGTYVKLTIEDEGIGIPEEYVHKIFDPYFTTKQKGSGLGLATTYSIIKNHDGYIEVNSELGVGTTFHIYFPASQKEIPHTDEVIKSPFISGKGKVLVMEDEEIIIDVLSDALEHFGYEVDFARNGADALELYKKSKALGVPFDVVIMDLTIPGGMGGKETIEKMLEMDPKVKAIVSSGYSNDSIMANYSQYGFSGVLIKPYKLNELGEVLHKVIKGETGEKGE